MNKVVKKIAKIALIVVASFIVTIIGICVLAVLRVQIKWERSFDNPIIDAKFKGWSTLELDDGICIKFPDVWELEHAGDNLYVIDEHGEQIAVGAKVPYSTPVEVSPTFMTSVYDSTWEKENIIWEQTVTYENLCRTWATELEYKDNRTETYLVLELSSNQIHLNYNYYFYFFSDEPGILYRDEVVAIAFSKDEHKAK